MKPSKIASILALGLLAGCASTNNPHDPLEGFNRAMFSFNEGVDKVALKPIAKGYDAAVPQPVRTGVSNAFSNVGDLWVGVNDLLQGKPGAAATDLFRVLVNSTIGILGLFDVASEMGLEKHNEDFGQTLGRWGVGSGAYIVLPFFGPRTLRDSLGLGVDLYVDPVANHDPVDVRNSLLALRAVSDRAELLPLDRTIEEASTDKYAYVRDAYLQRRRSLIYDGNPPREKLDYGAPLYVSPLAMSPVQDLHRLALVSPGEVIEPEPASAHQTEAAVPLAAEAAPQAASE
ncbi:MAG: VacJ family lipoprotein [Rhodocyclaceae bacterium]|nr:VacJ family lipoprotein [Rhodocyclaceae bacterium]MBX3669327.1 VacJ family lipoprotein [Rhodocyclaceae bacterium]